MSQKVEMILSVKDAQMVAAWKRGQQSVAAFNRELDKVGTKQARNKKQSGQFFKGMRTGLTGLVGGYVSVAGAAGILMEKNREILSQTEEVGKKFDEIFRKLRVQSGLRGVKGEEAQKRVLEIAERQAFESQQAGAASTQLVSSGFSAKEATGGSLEEFLRILNASNINGQELDPAELAKSISSYLQSQGLEKNEKNVALVGRKVQALFKGTNLQLPDLSELSKVSSIFKGMLSVEEQLGSMSALVDQIPAAEAKTGFRNFVLRLSTITEGQKPKMEALEQLGLQKEDVDFVGENLNEVLDKLAAGIQTVPEKDRKGVLNNIFGEKTIAAAQVLINDRQKIQDSFAIQNNTKGFLADVDEATSGRNAADRRQKVRQEKRRFAKDDQGDLIKKELEELAENSGVHPLFQGSSSLRFNIARWLGAGAETAANFGYGDPLDLFASDGHSPADVAQRRLNKRLEPASTQGNGEPVPLPPPPEKPSIAERLRNSPTVKRFTGENTKATSNVITFSQLRSLGIPIGNKQQESTDRHTKALEANTAALEKQSQAGSNQSKQPVKVEVKVSADSSTVPNGPRASSALARPAK